MTPEVREIADALLQPSKIRYEELREWVIEQVGYDAFRIRQEEAFKAIARGEVP